MKINYINSFFCTTILSGWMFLNYITDQYFNNGDHHAGLYFNLFIGTLLFNIFLTILKLHHDATQATKQEDNKDQKNLK